MRRSALLLSAAAICFLPGSLAAAELTLKRVLLSSGGVGYFEYEAKVVGDETLALPVRLDQVDDVMKSLVVYDSQGGIGEVSLPGRQPLADVFRDLPFSQSALDSPAALLNSLRGAEVAVTGARRLEGRILSVTSEDLILPEGGVITRTRVSLMTAAGVAQFLLEDADSLTFTDPALQGAVEKALVAMAQHAERDSRVLQLETKGAGERTLTVGYVVETPLWKTSYRLTLDAAPGAQTAELQGWAILENMSGEDWTDVELTLVSGNPVTFRQALYTTYYVERPEVPVEVMGRVLPQVDEEQSVADGLTGGYSEKESDDYARLAEQAPGAAAPEPSVTSNYGGEGSGAQDSAAITAAASSEATTQVIFTFPTPVTVESGHSLLVPFISDQVPAARVAYWQPATHPTHPLATVVLENDGETGLPPGVITLYERSADGTVAFVGDARLSVLPAGETRLISYALDQKVSVREEATGTQTVTGVKIADGVMTLLVRETSRTDFEITGAAKEDRVVLLEHPRWSGWELTEPEEEQLEVTPNSYRALVAVSAGEKADFSFAFERPVSQYVYLQGLDDSQLVYYLESDFMPAAAKEQLKLLVGLRSDLAERRRELDEIEQRINLIISDQSRIRQNLQSVPAESDLQRRYLKELEQQEDELASLRAAAEAKRREVVTAEAAVNEFIRQLEI